MCLALSSRSERIRKISGTFMWLMWIAMRRFWQLLQSFGLTPPQFVALFVLSRYSEARPMSDLTNAVLQDPPTMTGIIDRLEKGGLVERTRSEADRRVVLVRVTPAGLNLVRQALERFLDDDVAGCSSLTDEELAETEQLIRDIFRIHLRRLQIVDDKDLEDVIGRWEASLSVLARFAGEEVGKESTVFVPQTSG
jgi:DNA-binding MarR family transcriptional regulator